jgi:hypothetical protein
MIDRPPGVRQTPLDDLAPRAPLPSLTPAEASALPSLTWNLVNMGQDGTTLVVAVQLDSSPRIAGVEIVETATSVHVAVKGSGSPPAGSLVAAPARGAVAVVALSHPLGRRELLGANQ